MKNGKKTLKVLIVIVVMLVCAVAGVAYTYFFTDVFKTEKQKFFQYMAQNIGNVSSFRSNELENYYEKKKTQSYKNSGEFYTEIDQKLASTYMPNKKVYNEVKDFKILFDGEKDLANNYEHDVLSLKYSNNEKMTFELLREYDYLGIKVDSILKKYLVLENNDLKNFAKNMGLEDTKNIPDKIEIKNYEKYEFSEEELNVIKQKLYNVLDENLQETMFREEKFDSYSKYTLTLTNAQIKNIISKMYQSMINDEIIINKVKNFAQNELNMTEQEIEDQIENFKKEANDFFEGKDDLLDNDEETRNKDTDLVSICVYDDKKHKGNLSSIEIISNDGKIAFGISEDRFVVNVDEGTKDGDNIVYNPIASIILDKKTENDSLEYNISGEIYSSEREKKWDCSFKVTGIQSMNLVNENFSANYKIIDQAGEEEGIKGIYNNTVEFTDNIEKIDIKSNGVRINNYNAEKMQDTFGKLGNLIDSLNKKQMQSLGLEADQNPIFYVTPLASYIKMVALYDSGAFIENN